jgi:hypothetical protein
MNNDWERTQNFGNWVCFCPDMKGLETLILLVPFEEANLKHWA